jgi:Siphovirus-type tail component, C-terminal domain
MSATGGSWAWIDDSGIYHSLDRPNLRIRTLGNLYSVPPLKGEDVVIASYPGEFWLPKQQTARRITLEHLVFDQQGVGSVVYNTLQELAQAYGIANQGTLVHYRPDGTVVSASAQVNGWTSARSDLGPFTPVQQGPTGIWYLAVVPFNLADPYFYGDTVTVGPTDISGGSGSQTLTHPGTVRGWKATFTWDGPCTNPTVTNSTNSWSLEVATTVASGKQLIVDCSAWTALNDGTSVIANVTHSGGFPFFMVEPGANALTISASGTSSGAQLTTAFSPPYF